MPGSGGACKIAINAQQVYIITHLKERAFVEKLDFLTTPGYVLADRTKPLTVPGERTQLVITDKALFDFANQER